MRYYGESLLIKVKNFVSPLYKDMNLLTKKMKLIDELTKDENVDKTHIKVAALIDEVLEGHEKEIKYFLRSIGYNEDEIEDLMETIENARKNPLTREEEILSAVKRKIREINP